MSHNGSRDARPAIPVEETPASDEGASIVLYSSEDIELLSLADRILVFNGGTVAAELAGDLLDAFHLTDAAYGAAA
jgi:ribose transport system ATP-binding protein